MGFFSKFLGRSEDRGNVKVIGKLAFLEVDMHNHLLPGIDDGSKSTSQSIRLIDGLQHMGLNNFICTPHIMEGVHPNNKSTINRAFEELQSAVKKENKNIQIQAAAEHMIDDGIHKMITDDSLCVMPGGYVLIEMSYLSESRSLFHTIQQIRNLGYKPILAHPERYNYYHMDFNMYKQIKDAGCLLQLNLLSISRYYGESVKAIALTLIKSGMYDFVGTDLHHERHLAAMEQVVAKYPVRDLLKTCKILNPTLLDHNTSKLSIATG